MSFQLRNPDYFPIQIGELLIYLSDYQISESSSLKESGTADGNVILTSCFEMGIRLKLKGKLAPAHTPEQVISTLSGNMLCSQDLYIRDLIYPDAMLCGFTVSENSEMPDISLIFYCHQKPVLPEVNDA